MADLRTYRCQRCHRQDFLEAERPKLGWLFFKAPKLCRLCRGSEVNRLPDTH